MNRLSWDEYFMGIAKTVAKRSTCLRRKVGAIIVKDKRILSTGYNGSLSGLKHCEEIGCLRDKLNIPHGRNQEICRGLHAEQNALLFAVSKDLSNAMLYSSCRPCILCAKMIIQVGIKRVIFSDEYPDKMALQMFREAKVKLCQMK